LLLALAVAGCGSSSSVSAATYVKSVCTAASAWKNAIQKAGSRLQVASASLPKTKASYVNFVGALENATGAAETQLAAAGTPSVSNGKKISGALVQIFTAAKATLARASSDAAAIPTTSTQSFNVAATKVEGEVRSSLAGMANATPQKNPQLHAAAIKDATCQRLAASTGG
jgi:hypothetical protein